MPLTKASDLIVPQVMGDVISAKLESKIVIAPFAKIDNTLQGVAGDTITVPQYAYIGDAEDVAEGVEVDTTKLTATTTEVKIKKAMKAVELSDEAVLSSYGNPIGETNNQLAMAIASKIDADALEALKGAQKLAFFDTQISYDGVVDTIDLLSEESAVEKVMFVHPKQLTTLRHDSNFISKEKYGSSVMATGEIGTIGGARIVPSKRIEKNAEPVYLLTKTAPEDFSTTYTSYYTVAIADGIVTYTQVSAVGQGESAPSWEPNKYFKKMEANTMYLNPVVQLKDKNETDDDVPALTVYVKRDTNVETERQSLKRVTDISVDKFYAVALTNQSKVVLAGFAV